MTKTILVADDSKTMQKIVELTFRTTQFSVVKASSADEALMKLPRAKPDVVLADSQMPGKDGYQLCEELKRDPATAHIPVVLLLGNLESFDEARARAAKITGHIKKPFDTQSLITQVTEIVGLAAGSAVSTPMSFAASLEAKRVGATPAPAALPPAAPLAAAPRANTPAPVPPRAATPSPMAASRPIVPTPTFGALFPAPSAASPSGSISGRAQSASWPAPPMTPSGRPIAIGPDEDALKAPMLEPPRRPSLEATEEASKVDMWSLAEPVSDDIPISEPSSADLAPPPVRSAPPPRPVLRVSEEVATRAAPQIAQAAAAAGPALSKDELLQMAREVIERVVWEVVPDLAETIIREELRRLTRPDD
jgi:CheY-like chemotaxis protein